MRRQLAALPITVLLAANLSPVYAQQQDGVVFKVNEQARTTTNSGVAAYWTRTRMQNAKPLDKKENRAVNKTPAVNPAATAASSTGTSASSEAQPPSANIPAKVENQVLTPPARTTTQTVTPNNAGTSKARFTSSRIVPLSADTSYPYSTVGKLFFTVPGYGDAVCSASVIGRRVILTAGHCVHSGNGSSYGWYTNFMFVPAYRDGFDPYYSWDWQYIITTSAWINGGGGVPNSGDYAMIEATDNYINYSTRRVGDVVGTLGWKTNSLNPNHTTMLGYPCNFDYCEKMHQVTAQSFRSTTANTVEYGSDMRGGSSGGPWVQDFGTLAVGQSTPGINQVVGITSYGPSDAYASQKYQGSSVPNTNFVNMWNTICGRRAGNCN